MSNLFAARSQMGISLAFHIIFACIGMVMPFFMAVSHLKWLRTGNERYKNITRAWSNGVAIFFVTGAVSGTILSFELGMLWPGFMRYAGPIIGMPFSLEGTAFFIEAIALGFYLYGWNRLNKWFHWFTGLVIGLTGIASGILVVAANSWMNSPTGFNYVNGQFIHIRPFLAMANPDWIQEALHMTLAAFAATGMAVAGVHALMVYKKKNVDFHWKAFRIAATFGAIAAVLQPFSGDFSAKMVARHQPAKLAAMEALYVTRPSAPVIIGGIPDTRDRVIKNGIRIPGLLSFLVHNNFHDPVTGLDHFPPQDYPPVGMVHLAFDIMIGLGIFLFLWSLLFLYGEILNKAWLRAGWFLKMAIASIPLGFMAIEAGWTVTEVGRQPWIIYNIMRTADAVTPMPGINYTFDLFTGVYCLLSAMVIFLFYRQIKMVPVLYDPPAQ
ncbi:MAG: cytochrome ubiquinol oxidase subunit I [Chitinophagaceae bacterium]